MGSLPDIGAFLRLMRVVCLSRARPPVLDASEDGFGVCTRDLGEAEVEQIGRWNDRWRYRRLPPDQWAPRSRALSRLDSLYDIVSVRGSPVDHDELFERDQWTVDDAFPEVPLSVSGCKNTLIPFEGWDVIASRTFKFPEPIHVLEARSGLWRVRHISRNVSHHNLRHLILSDNLSWVLTASKGRSSDFGLLIACRIFLAVCLGCGVLVRLRWVASELNAADPASMWWDPFGQFDIQPFPRPAYRSSVRDGRQGLGRFAEDVREEHIRDRASAIGAAALRRTDEPRARLGRAEGSRFVRGRSSRHSARIIYTLCSRAGTKTDIARQFQVRG